MYLLQILGFYRYQRSVSESAKSYSIYFHKNCSTTSLNRCIL